MKSRMGKVSRKFLSDVVLRHLGAPNEAVLQGPKLGLDNAVVRLGKDRVLIITTDPVSMIPSVGMDASAWLSVHLIASDYATSGNVPEFATFDYNIPDEVSEEQAERYLLSVDRECRRLGIAIVAGNTGRYPGAALTVIGGGAMFGTAGEGGYLLSSMARTGDDIVITKGAAIETTGALSTAFRNHVEEKIGARLASEARGYLGLCSVVKDAQAAARVGIGKAGVTAMHDATEGGVLGGLAEMAGASGKDFVVDQREILVSEATKALCSAFGIDPLVSLSEGALLATCRREMTPDLVRRLRREGVRPAVIGRVEGKGGRLLIERSGGPARILVPPPDPYWKAYSAAVRRGLN